MNVTLTIDGKQVTVPEGTLIVNAAKKIGIDIPVFCYHPKMEPVGMCRMCLVEVGRPVIDRATGQPILEADGSPKLQWGAKLETACTTPVSTGMVVRGLSEKAQAGRKDIIEFLLTSHPLDCPICDKGGECPLQNLSMGWGPGESRYLYDEKKHLAKHVPLGELIYLDRERCIQCGRCVRFQDEIAGDPVIGFYNRGRSLEIVTFSEPGFDSYFSGNTTDICPVGALTTADFRFKARPWEMKSAASICPHCPVGCNLTFNVRREASSGGDWVIKRALPRQNEWVNEIWICDKGRFGYHFSKSPERLTRPLVRKNGELVEAAWEEALDLVADRFRSAGAGLLSLASGRLSNEDLFNLGELTSSLGGKKALYGNMAGGDLVAQVGLGQGTNLSDLGAGSAILVVASDLHEEAPIWWLRVKQAAERGAALIVLNPRPTRLEHYATAVIRYPYGSEAAAVLALLKALPGKERLVGGAGLPQPWPDLPAAVEELGRSPELLAAARAFAEAENGIVIYGSEGAGLAASQALAQMCTNLLRAAGRTGKPGSGLLPVWQRANDQGAWDTGFRPLPDLADAMQAATALYIVAADPAGDDLELHTSLGQAGQFLVVQDLFLTDTARLADAVLPVDAWSEREGTFTSGERRVQRFYPVVPDPTKTVLNLKGAFDLRRQPSEARLSPDFAVTGQIGQRLGLQLETRLASRTFDRLASALKDYAGLSYARLAQVVEQWPIIGHGDVYYGGASYENRQGLGVQLAPAAQRTAPVWPEKIRAELPRLGLLAVPVTRLYDRGSTLLGHGSLLKQRIPEPFIVLNPADAERMRIPEGALVRATLLEENTRAGKSPVIVTVRLSEDLPERIALVPRSFGLPIDAPASLEVRIAEKVNV